MIRKIKKLFTPESVQEGAGVSLHRGFGYYQLPLFDPFLLFDDFSSDREADYIQGFPWHPHRGIETITYVLKGNVEHGDSLGNSGVISSGDVQWMTAGSGILHQEMPEGDDAGRGADPVDFPGLYQRLDANQAEHSHHHDDREGGLRKVIEIGREEEEDGDHANHADDGE